MLTLGTYRGCASTSPSVGITNNFPKVLEFTFLIVNAVSLVLRPVRMLSLCQVRTPLNVGDDPANTSRRKMSTESRERRTMAAERKTIRMGKVRVMAHLRLSIRNWNRRLPRLRTKKRVPE